MKVAETTALAREIAVQVEAFAKRVAELRSMLDEEPPTERSSPESLRRSIALQGDELTLALEELRAQNEALYEALAMPHHAMARKLLIAFVARRDTRAFRAILKGLEGKRSDTFSLDLRPRGGPPFRASLPARRVRPGRDGTVELCWTIRPSQPS